VDKHLDNIDFISAREVAKILHTTPAKVKAAIKNHTMPIGMVGREGNSTEERTIIPLPRFKAWIKGKDLGA